MAEEVKNTEAAEVAAEAPVAAAPVIKQVAARFPTVRMNWNQPHCRTSPVVRYIDKDACRHNQVGGKI